MAESLTTPAILPQTIAENGDANVIPATNDQTEGKASIAYGFPPLTSTPIADGGKMVRRADFNGLFNLLSQYALFTQNGGLFTFNQSVSDAIGGYPLGAQLIYTDTAGNCHIVKSLIPNNTYNFNTDATYIDGAKWGYAFIDTNKENVFTKSQYITSADDTNAISFKNTNLATNNTTPAANVDRVIRALANDNSLVSQLILGITTSGNNYAALYARRTIGGTNVNNSIQVGVRLNGTGYTYAPNPPSNSKDTNIATTKWISDLLKGDMPSANNGRSGWAYLGNNVGICWGHLVQNTGYIETLAHAFDAYDSYIVVCNGDIVSAYTVSQYTVYIDNQTATSFRVNHSRSGTAALSYVAIGKMTIATKP